MSLVQKYGYGAVNCVVGGIGELGGQQDAQRC